MNEKKARDYLARVLVTWEAFCKGHRRFEKALIEILNENRRLREENERLKGK